MYCVICGDFDDHETFTAPVRFWSPDDGWRIGRFCPACKPLMTRRPKPGDYAYDTKATYLSDMDEAIDALFG